MKVKTWIPLVLAVVLGLAALKFTRDAMSREGKPEEGKYATTVTALVDIAPGQPISAESLTVAKVEATAIPTGSFTNPIDLTDRVSLTGFVKGQTVLESLLAPKGSAAGMQALIPEGMRAITLQVDEFSGLGGLLLPDSHVDIIAVIRGEDSAGSTSRTIVQNVKVRAVGRQLNGTTPAADPNLPPGTPAPIATNVTLLVTPEQAEAVQLASIGGKPWLVLRNSNDQESFESEGTSMADLRGDRDGLQGGAGRTKLAGVEKLEAAGSSTKLTFDPSSQQTSVETTGPAGSSKTRTVMFIRSGKAESITVDVPQAPSTDWIGAETDINPAATK